MKRILHFPGVMTQGGVESLVMGWYERIDRSEFQFDFCVSRTYPDPIDETIKKLGGKIIYSTPIKKKKGLFKHINEIKSIILNNGPYDAVHIHSIHMGVFSLIAAKKAKVKVRVYHSHNIQNATLKKTPYIVRRIIENLCSAIINKYATKRVACSKEAGFFVFKRQKFDVINNSVDLSRFKPYDEKTRLYLRNRLGIPSDAIVVGNVGRFVHEKNQKLFLELYDYDTKHVGKLYYLLVGEGVDKKSIEQMIDDRNAHSHFILTGSKKDTENFYNCMDVFCLPSLFEGLGIVAVEAQACGVPCLVSNGVPNEANMEIGLFESLSLKEEMQKWSATIYELSAIEHADAPLIKKKIEKKGYGIEQTIKYIENNLYND